MVKKTFKISGMHCSSCAMSVEWELEDLGAKCKCSYAKAEMEVEFDHEKLSEEKIKETIKKLGYELAS